MNGGVVPGGRLPQHGLRHRRHLGDRQLDLARPGWKKTLTTEMPRSDCDSMCSMSLTVVVSDRSKLETMRSAISSADRPP